MIKTLKALSAAQPNNQELKDLVTALETIPECALGINLSALIDEVLASKGDVDAALMLKIHGERHHADGQGDQGDGRRDRRFAKDPVDGHRPRRPSLAA